MLFMLWLTVRLLTRLLVLPNGDDGTKDLEILVLRHQLSGAAPQERPSQVHRRRPGLARRHQPGAPPTAVGIVSCHAQTLLRWHRTLVRRKWTYGKERK